MKRILEELQRIKDAVLVELNELCKVDDLVEISPRRWVKSYEKSALRIAWFDCYVIDIDGTDRRVFKASVQLPSDDPYWQVAYAVLGLQARDMVAAKEDSMRIDWEVYHEMEHDFDERGKQIEDLKMQIRVEGAVNGKEITVLKGDIDRLRTGIEALSRMTPYPEIALKYLNPPMSQRGTLEEEWDRLKKQLGAEHWTVGEMGNVYGAFCHGWYGRLGEAAYQQENGGGK